MVDLGTPHAGSMSSSSCYKLLFPQLEIPGGHPPLAALNYPYMHPSMSFGMMHPLQHQGPPQPQDYSLVTLHQNVMSLLNHKRE